MTSLGKMVNKIRDGFTMDVAYGKRHILSIKKREVIKNLYLLIRLLYKKSTKLSPDGIKSILIYPEICDVDMLADVCNKLCWGFPNKNDLNLYIPLSKTLRNINLEKLTTPNGQRRYITNNARISFLYGANLKSHFKSDAIFVHDAREIFQSFLKFNLGKTQIIDKQFFSVTECNVWKKLYYDTFSKAEKTNFQKISLENYKKLLKINKNKEIAYCFLTGPSFDKYPNFNFETKSFKIICNSIVKNAAFLNYIGKPDLLVFADPVFHFSACEYAATFRDQALSVIEQYDCYFMVPEETVPLLLAHYPQIRDKIIGVRIASKAKKINFPALDRFYVKGSESIVTLFMVPVASAVSNKIFLIGADGRKQDENYFWKHNSSVQYDDLMETVFKTHPSFFRDRLYSDAYDRYCKYMESVLQHGEKSGKEYYSLTPSYIPALRKRFCAKNNTD